MKNIRGKAFNQIDGIQYTVVCIPETGTAYSSKCMILITQNTPKYIAENQ